MVNKMKWFSFVVSMVFMMFMAPLVWADPPPLSDRLDVTWERENVCSMQCAHGTCAWVCNIYTSGLSVAAPGDAPSQVVRLTQLNTNGDVVGSPIVLGEFISTTGCPFTNFSYEADTVYASTCRGDTNCSQDWWCTHDGEVHTIYGACASVPEPNPAYERCECRVNFPCIGDDPIWDGSAWSPNTSAATAALESCDENDPITPAGGCGEEDETTCYPLCGGATGY